MEKKFNLSLLILCAILFQEIASLSDKNNTDSLDLLLRKKRVIDNTPSRNERPQLQDIPYVVQVQRIGYHVCSGSILSAHVVLTAANCVEDDVRYTVVAGTVLARRDGSTHFVNGILRHPNHNPQSFANNIALLSILEPILLGRDFHRPIEIYQSPDGQLPHNTVVTSSGWGLALGPNRGIGCYSRRSEKLVVPNELRSINIPTISRQECSNQHTGIPWISNQFICTHHREKRCAAGDEGNPLVFGEHLVGVLSFYGRGGPDIFVNVALPAFRNWIITHMNQIPPYATGPMQPLHLHMELDRRRQRCPKIHPCHD